MAKKPNAVTTNGIDIASLKRIVDATAAEQIAYVSQTEGQPLIAHNPPLIEINPTITDPSDPTRVAARSLPAAQAYLDGLTAKSKSAASQAQYAIIADAVLPPAKKRGATGAGAPTIYPFNGLEVGQSFFVPVSEKHPDPVKTLGSTVSSANRRYAVPTGETKTIERAVRGEKNRAVIGPDGKKKMETVTLPVLKYTRKFTIRGVEKGVKYGDWTAPETGALIARVE